MSSLAIFGVIEGIRVEGASKTFTLAQGPAREATVIRALEDITFELDPGSILGVIGRNGAGKTTLLRLLSGTLQQDHGTVSRSGSVAAVPVFGHRFDPDATGREAARDYLTRTLVTNDADERLSRIEQFAELQAFFDAPLHTYSTGMSMRLALASAISLEPDVLLLDEVFAAGDEAFETKCLATIADFRMRGKSIVFATHKMEFVEEECDVALWLDRGCVAGLGDPRPVVAAYKAFSDNELSGCS